MHLGYIYCQGPLKQTKPYNSHPNAGGLRWSHVGSPVLGLKLLSSYKLGSAVSLDFPFMSFAAPTPPQLVEFIIPLFYWSLAYWLTVHLCICRKFLCGNNSPSIFWINTRRCQGMQESSVQILPILGSRNSIYVLQISVIFGVKQTNKQRLFNYDLLNYREWFTLKRYSYSWTPWWVDHYGRDII